jgi:hypothetical protein
MLTPPSLNKKQGICWSRDPALLAPDAGDADAAKQWQRDVEQARETGAWAGLVKPGAMPTTFYVEPMEGETARQLVDDMASGRVGIAMLASLAFRACVNGVDNFGDVKIMFEEHPRYGRIASAALISMLDAIDPQIVAELGGYCWRRALQISPK